MSRETTKAAANWYWAAGICGGLGLFEATQTVMVMRSMGMHHAWTALFVTVLESVRDKLVAEGEKASALSASDDNRVRAAVSGFLDVAEAAPDAMRVLVSARYGDPAGAKLARMVQSSAVAGIIQNTSRTFSASCRNFSSLLCKACSACLRSVISRKNHTRPRCPPSLRRLVE